MIKKITFTITVFLVLVLSSVVGQDVLKIVPVDSKAVVYIKNLDDTYTDLKTVPTLKTLLLEPFNAELLISSFAQIYFNALKIDFQSFINQLDVDLAVFVQEPREKSYEFGFSIGPINNPEAFAKDLDKLLEPLKDYGIVFNPIVENIGSFSYLAMVQDKNLYSSSKKGVEDFEEIIYSDSGLYYRINTSDYQGEGYFYPKDGFLVGGGIGTADTESIDVTFVKSPQEVPFFGNVFFTSSLIPNDIANYSDLINIVVDYEIAEKLINSSKGIEVNADLQITDNLSEISNNNYLKLKTEAKVDDIIPILNENNIKHKKVNENMLEFYIQSETTNQNRGKTTVTQTFYVWKNEFLYVSVKNPDELQKVINTKPRLSENDLFNKLSQRIGIGDVAYVFVDLTPIFRSYVPNLKGQYGFLVNVTLVEKNKLKTDFIVQ